MRRLQTLLLDARARVGREQLDPGYITVVIKGDSVPQATVAAIVTVKDGDGSKVLLTRRAAEPFKGQWCLPGGHIDQYEPARDAIIREVKEETGLAIDPRFFGCFDEIIPEKSIHAVVVVFEGLGIGKLNIQASEVETARWFSIPEARRLRMAFKHNDILGAYGGAKWAES